MKELPPYLRFPALTGKARWYLVLGAVVVVGLASTLSYLLMHNQNVALFSRTLQADQVAEVEERLTAWNVPFVIRENQISVPSAQRNEIELRLSLQGLPHEHLTTTGETLVNAGAMTPQSVLDAQTREGLGADIALGLRSIEGVRDARVIVAPASQGLFADEPEQTTKASVRVTLDPGTTLSKATINGIKTFVADGVAGLVPQNVAVLDDRGVALGTDGQSDAEHDGLALQTSLQSALDATVGIGMTLVRVSLQADPRSVQRHEVRRAPVGVVSDRTVREQYRSNGKTYAKTHADVDRGTDTIDQETHIDAGGTKRLSIAVFVDDSKSGDVTTIRTLVSAAAGLDRQRGDALEIATMAFPRPTISKPSGAGRSPLADLIPAIPGVLITFAVVIALAVFARPISALLDVASRRYAVETTQRLPLGSFSPRELHSMLVNEPPHTAAVVLSRLPSAVSAEVLELFSTQERRNIVDRMSKTVSPIVADLGADVAPTVIEERSQ